jgi:hypothetical protein
VDHSDVESDVLIINEGIVRFCKQCGDSTLWKRASEVREQPNVLVAAGPGATVAFSAQSTDAESTQLAPPAQTASTVATPQEPKTAPAAPFDNRRKHPRTRVNYKACIRRSGFTDDVVTCEDMSKGGLCFRSRKQYFVRTNIEVAVPYSPGGNAIFVPAEIAWVVEITKDKLYKCGAAYRRASKQS